MEKNNLKSKRLESVRRPPQKLAVIMAHPDDAELLCFGTIMYFKALNYEISIVTVSDGSRGISLEAQSEQLERIESGCIYSFSSSRTKSVKSGSRQNESRAAFEGTGAKLHFLSQDDGSILSNIDLISSIEQHLLLIEPDVVITHSSIPCAVEHQDHLAVGNATVNAASRISTVKTVLQAQPVMSGLMPFVPNYFVNITSHFKEKMTAIGKHRSQSDHHPYMTEEFQRTRAQGNAFAAGRQRFANHELYEAFHASLILMT